MQILVVDGQGGGIGKLLVAKIKAAFPHIHLRAVGTNSIATASMLKAGADAVATGENAVLVGARDADIIVGPAGIVIADALLGEITPKMAVSIGQSTARKILIPTNMCSHTIVGTTASPVASLVTETISEIQKIISEKN